MTIGELYKLGVTRLLENKIEESSLKSKMLLCNILKQDKPYLVSHDRQDVTKEDELLFLSQIEELIEGKPIQYIVNKQEFMRLSFYVDESVLIPQPDTEILVEEVIKLAKGKNKIKVLDLCTGSGAIGISIAKQIDCSVTLSDISKQALEIAKKNVISNQVEDKITIIQSNLFENIKEKFDLIVSNPPYIQSKVIPELSREVQHEPKLALDGGVDGLNFYRKIIQESDTYLQQDGYLCLEIGYDQKTQILDLVEKSKKYKEIYTKEDLAGNDRIMIARKVGN